MTDLLTFLKETSYPGRGIVVGKDRVYYFIMGRSENSRNRVFVETEDGIRTEAHDPAKLSDPMGNVSAVFGTPLTQNTKPQLLEEGKLLLAGMEVDILHTPGHSNGGVCCVLPDGQGILTGDTLFAHGYGRTDFADGHFAALHQSLRRLFRLTPKMVTYPGHDVTGVVGRDPVGE